MRMRSGQAFRGFTLLELLICIATIAVLLSLLFLVFGRVREAARSVSCTEQLRQLHVGLVAYAQEHRGYLPRGGTNSTDDSGFGGWQGTAWLKPTVNPAAGFSAYCGGQEVVNRLVVCPANRAQVTAVHAYQYTPEGYPYICNYEAMTQTGLSRSPANLWRVDTGRLLLLFDSGVGADWKGPGLTSVAGWDRLGARHQQRCNALWADGRVSAMPVSELKVENLVPQVRD